MMTERGANEEAGAGFAPGMDNARWTYAGSLTYANAGAVLAAALELELPTGGEVDLIDVGAIDSAAVAVLVALQRRAVDEGRSLLFANVPAALSALADLYGVEGILVA
jgi:phospholipid transport system transporter-binding protein